MRNNQAYSIFQQDEKEEVDICWDGDWQAASRSMRWRDITDERWGWE